MSEPQDQHLLQNTGNYKLKNSSPGLLNISINLVNFNSLKIRV